ncbi:MAG: ATP synthase F1 subunit epsilon [Planctomycetes bacterium]|nr:ATP synthase F1 subunit epsilon [Planctomycetota bacterium]
MAGTLTLRVITPERIALDTLVQSVRVPGADGSLGILPRHAPMVAALDTGLLHFHTADGEAVMFVSGGFAEVRGETLRVVTEAGERPDEIDEARAKEAEQRARERMAGTRPLGEGEAVDLARAELALRRALWRQRAVEYSSQ